MMLIFWSLIAYTKPTTNMKSLSQEARVLGVTLHNLMLKTENIVFTCSPRLNHFSNDLFMKNLSRWCVVLSDPFKFTKKKCLDVIWVYGSLYLSFKFSLYFSFYRNTMLCSHSSQRKTFLHLA